MLKSRSLVDKRSLILPKRSLPFLIMIGLFGLGLGFIVNMLDPLLYTEKTRQIAAPFLKNTVLSFITIMALVVALIAQPLVGRWSDHNRGRWGRRIPYLTGGVIGLCFSLALVGWAEHLWLLIIGAMLASASSNTVQGAWQALIPDLVPPNQRGTATAVKTILEAMGAVAGVTITGYLLTRGILWGGPAIAVTLFIAILLITLLALTGSRNGLPPSAQSSSNQPNHPPQREPFSVAQVKTRLWQFVRHSPPFFWWIINRILFWSAGISLRTFMLNYVEDKQIVSLTELKAISNQFIVGLVAVVVLIVLLSGILSDQLGRRPLLIGAGLLAGSGTLLLMISPTLSLFFVAAGCIVISGGIFAGASWALATDLAPTNQGALYLGLANGATVIGSISGRLGGPLIDGLNHLSGDLGIGYSVVFALAALCFFCSSLVILKIPSDGQAKSMP
jgi:MFS family permease